MSKRLYACCRPILLAALLLTPAGCQLAGAVSALEGSPGTTKAQYVPQKKEPMLVLVEDWNLQLDSPIYVQHLQVMLRKWIKQEKIAPLVDQDKLEKIRDANTPDDYGKITIDALGREVGARQVLYVQIDRAAIVQPAGSDQMRGEMDGLVKIVDSVTGENRWPTAPNMAVSIQTPWATAHSISGDDLRAQMADKMAQAIARFFYDWQPDENATKPE